MVLDHVTYSIPHLNIPRMSQTSRVSTELLLSVHIYIMLKMKVYQEEQRLEVVLKALGYMGALG